MINIIRADLFKLRKTTIIKVLFLITSLSAACMIIMSNQIAEGNISKDYSGIGFLFSDGNVTSILGSLLAGTMICGDFDNKIISSQISGGEKRSTIVISKMVSYLLGVTIIIIPYVVASIICAIIGNNHQMGAGVGFLNLIQSNSGCSLSANEILRVLGIAIVILLVYLAQFSACVPLSMKIKKPVIVIAIYYALTLAIAQLTSLASKSDTLNNIISLTPYGGNSLFITLNSSCSDVVKVIFVSVICIGIFICFSYLLFRKQDIK